MLDMGGLGFEEGFDDEAVDSIWAAIIECVLIIKLYLGSLFLLIGGCSDH